MKIHDLPQVGQARAVIERVSTEVDAGHFPISCAW